MKKLHALCLILAVVFYSTAALSRICFLADISCQEGSFDVGATQRCVDQNPSWTPESQKCETLYYGNSTCNDTSGNYFEEQGCIDGYQDLSGSDKFECLTALSCGKCCPNDQVRCKSKYQICGNNSKPSQNSSNDSCEDSEGVKFLKCECDTNEYPTQCNAEGLAPELSNICTGDNGTWYKSCKCATGYYQTAFNAIKCSETCPNNCRLGQSTPLPGMSDAYCWEGAECLPEEESMPGAKCHISYQSDFDLFWGGYDATQTCRNLTVNCPTLGYPDSAGSGVLCKDDSEPFRCPFDHTQVYCESGVAGNCIFIDKADCEKTYFGSECSVDTSRCYNATACKIGFEKTVDGCSKGLNGNWSLGQKDGYGCSMCMCESTCKNTVTVVPSNAAPVYTDCDACGEPTKQIITDFTCNAGYKKEGDKCVASCNPGNVKDVSECGTSGGWKLGTADAGGCYPCIAKTCSDYTDPDTKDPLGRNIRLTSTESEQYFLTRGAVGRFQTGDTLTTCYSAYECESGLLHGFDDPNDICKADSYSIINGKKAKSCGVTGSDEFCENNNGAGYYALYKYRDTSVYLNGYTFRGQCPETYCWTGNGHDIKDNLMSQGKKPDYVTLCVNGKWDDHC